MRACAAHLPTGVTFAELKHCLPAYVIETLREALVYFGRKIKGFAMPDSILTGVETRSSSPVRISRDDNHRANIAGLYPMGRVPVMLGDHVLGRGWPENRRKSHGPLCSFLATGIFGGTFLINYLSAKAV